ncbi:hypothetical protein [Deinococcus radiotolerans]|uniref:Uncharacterized protein n=1 Tax=Deinococcus radiotolerans TaxID=1309407 RepID=A0ABQ2FEM3_9DEIO|nr:hypothetical protein [Deinococcus radiotolerans]GGK88694.1 hypothetical protein GCM10010844_03980 [Deinococcus radiotolerans]
MSAPATPPPARSVSWTRVALTLLCALLLLLAVVLGSLTLGLFSSLASNGPLWLRSLGAVASTLAGAAGLGGLSGLTLAFILMALTSGLAGLAAFVKPRP